MKIYLKLIFLTILLCSTYGLKSDNNNNNNNNSESDEDTTTNYSSENSLVAEISTTLEELNSNEYLTTENGLDDDDDNEFKTTENGFTEFTTDDDTQNEAINSTTTEDQESETTEDQESTTFESDLWNDTFSSTTEDDDGWTTEYDLDNNSTTDIMSTTEKFENEFDANLLCDIDNITTNCDCNYRNEVIFFLFLQIKLFCSNSIFVFFFQIITLPEITHDLIELNIRNCKTLIVKTDTFSEISSLKQIHFSNIENLILESNSLIIDLAQEGKHIDVLFTNVSIKILEC